MVPFGIQLTGLIISFSMTMTLLRKFLNTFHVLCMMLIYFHMSKKVYVVFLYKRFINISTFMFALLHSD